MPGSGPRRRSALVARLSGQPGGGSPTLIVDELRRCILDGEVPPGSPIPVDQVAAVFGVSRIPVREALMTLIGEGLVDHRLNGGYRIAQMTAAEFSEIYLVREALETAALRRAAELAGPEDDERARSAHAALEGAIAAGDLRAYHRESRSFHLALLRPCRMRRLLGMLTTAWNLTEPIQPMSHMADADRALLHADHGLMLRAFIDRDLAGLTRSFGDHHGRLQSYVALLPRHTGLFADP